MATINHAINEERVPAFTDVLWETMGNADEGDAYEVIGNPSEMILQASGTIGGATVAFQGSNDGTNWVGLVDPGGTAIALTAAGLASVRDIPRYVRPTTSGGTGTDIDVRVLVRWAT